MARTKSSHLSHQPSKRDASSTEEEAVPESDSDDSDSEGSCSNYVLQPVVRSNVSSSKRSGDDEIAVPDSKKRKAVDGGGSGPGFISRVWSEAGDFWSKYPYIAASLDSPSLPAGVRSTLKENLSGIGDGKAKKLDDKWKQLAVEQRKLDCKMLELMREALSTRLSSADRSPSPPPSQQHS